MPLLSSCVSFGQSPTIACRNAQTQVMQSTLSHPDYVHTSGIELCIACMGGIRTVVYERLYIRTGDSYDFELEAVAGRMRDICVCSSLGYEQHRLHSVIIGPICTK